MVKYKTLKKKFYILILFLGLFTSLKSQHCFWDYCRFIVLDVRDSLTNQIVDDLTIILSDGSGKLAHMCTGDPVRFDRKKFDEMTIRIRLKKIK